MRCISTDERGNAAIYLIWLISIVALLFLLVINISNIFVTGVQSSNSAEQAAIAGTSVIITETKKAIEAYDDDPLSIPGRVHHDMKTIEELVDEKQSDYRSSGMTDDQAYVKALDTVLLNEINTHPLLKDKIREHFIQEGLNDKIYATVTGVVQDNHGNQADTQIILSNQEWRLEVETTINYTSIADETYIPEIEDKIAGKGIGPTLDYLRLIYE
ncbi:hypothetical protein ACFOZ1_09445 [Gracilibacillus marinus]|jgi:hypothetical protein|uniref:Flp pilus-assembly TadG-like N-terminal domain-containing protein n=1 Tax=Gracilibacillus marinus TaxID=630535 RepID=A0ABV8VYB3_9BACI